MKTLFDSERVDELKERLGRLTPASERRWGKMTASQAVAHCVIPMEWAVGDKKPERMLLGRLVGPLIKKVALGNDDPMPKNTATMKELIIGHEPDLDTERQRLVGLMHRFAAAGPAGCTTHPHTLFGSMTTEQWAILMYKHADHHLRQFGV